MTEDKFIDKARIKHNNKYDYSHVEYVNSVTDVEIICPEHGEFWQKPSEHLRGCGCPICGNENKGKKTITNEELVNKFKEKHGDKYDYSKVIYKGPKEKVIIICREHGEFRQLPFAHINGQGCPKCKGIGLNKEDYISKFNEIHGDKYDYSESVIKKAKDKIKIICPEHGYFYQTPQKHILGQGCPECAKKSRTTKNSINFSEFVKRAKEIHGEEYEYNCNEYKNIHSKTEITCKIHGKYRQLAYDHLNGHGCPVCGMNKSNSENEIYEYVCSLIGENNVERGNRTVLNGKEIDIYIPKMKIGIEYNGCLWHSEKYGKDRQYHLNKTNLCIKQGIKLYHIFEDEYINKKEIILSKIKHIIGCDNSEKIYARKCYVKEICNNDARDFLDKNHIQGFEKAKVHIGCYYNSIIIGVMSFKEEKENKWNLVRFATNIQYNCIGVGGKILHYFNDIFKPEEIKTFADRRWTILPNDNLYTKIGFKLDKILPPDYRYISSDDINRKHKFNYRKGILSKRYGFPMDMTESEMCVKIGLYKIYDCGLYKYTLKKATV